MKKPGLKIFLILFIGLLLLAAAIFFIYMRWSFRVEDYCHQKAVEIIGGEDNWAKTLLPAQPDEYPYVGKGGMIAPGFREQLKCEGDPNIQRRFKEWF